MNDCPRAGWLFGACKFSPRYDIGAPADTGYSGAAAGVICVIEASKPKTYVRDVCERCGKAVERAR